MTPVQHRRAGRASSQVAHNVACIATCLQRAAVAEARGDREGAEIWRSNALEHELAAALFADHSGGGAS